MPATGESAIPYQEMMERALRGVMREALARVAADGLPGGHHFYIAFRTGDDGVAMPAHLRARHPDEMTIVLQHRFQGLETGEESFSVTLSFGGRPARLTVPFAAVTGFADPAVPFGLQFGGDAGEAGAEDADAQRPADDSPKEGAVVALDAFRKT